MYGTLRMEPPWSNDSAGMGLLPGKGGAWDARLSRFRLGRGIWLGIGLEHYGIGDPAQDDNAAHAGPSRELFEPRGVRRGGGKALETGFGGRALLDNGEVLVAVNIQEITVCPKETRGETGFRKRACIPPLESVDGIERDAQLPINIFHTQPQFFAPLAQAFPRKCG